MGFHFPSCFWDKTLLIAYPEVLVFTLNFFFSLWKSKYRLTCNLVLKFFKCLLIFIILFPFFLSLKFIKSSCYMTKILDKASIEVCKSQEAFYFFYLGRGFSFFDCFDFFSSNYYSQYGYLLDIKVTL